MVSSESSQNAIQRGSVLQGCVVATALAVAGCVGSIADAEAPGSEAVPPGTGGAGGSSSGGTGGTPPPGAFVPAPGGLRLDAFAKHIARAKTRDAIRWGNIGKHIWPNDYVGATWADELGYLKYWLRRRLAWLDKNLPGACASIPTGAPPSPVPAPAPAPVRETAARSVPVSAGAAPVYIPIEGPVEPAYAMWACRCEGQGRSFRRAVLAAGISAGQMPREKDTSDTPAGWSVRGAQEGGGFGCEPHVPETIAGSLHGDLQQAQSIRGAGIAFEEARDGNAALATDRDVGGHIATLPAETFSPHRLACRRKPAQ